MITVDDRLAALFQHGPLRGWDIDDIRKDKLMRFAQAYVMMAKAKHRPAASGGLSAAQLRDDRRLHREAVEYAFKFNQEEDSDKFWIGCSHYSTNRASVLAIEAARLLACGELGTRRAVKLLRMALREIENQKQE